MTKVHPRIVSMQVENVLSVDEYRGRKLFHAFPRTVRMCIASYSSYVHTRLCMQPAPHLEKQCYQEQNWQLDFHDYSVQERGCINYG